MKKILYIHQYFKTPKEAGGTRSYWFSLGLIEAGYQVVMLTGRKNQQKFISREVIEGINVIYIKNKYSNNFGVFRRLLSFIQFMLVSAYIALKEKNVSLVFATSTPLTVGFTALILKFFKRLNYVFEVRDLWPEVPIQMGAIKSKFAKQLTVGFERLVYNNSLHIIALSPGMQNGVLKQNIPDDKVSMIPNMAKIDIFYPHQHNLKLKQKLKLPDSNFFVLHFGTMGIANGLEYILEAAKLLILKNDSIMFLFAGEGSQESKLKKIASENKLSNVHFLGNFDMAGTAELVNLCHCTICTFANIQILDTNSPNKFFDSLSAGKPIIVNSRGWTKDIIQKYNCGAFTDPDDPSALADLLNNWEKERDLLTQLSINARKLAEENYDKGILVPMFVNIIKKFC